MDSREVVRPLAVFIVIIAVSLMGTILLAFVSGSVGGPDGESIDGQSPDHFQPENVNPDTDPEDGNIDVEDAEARILVDTRHDNAIDRAALEPVVDAAFESGIVVEYDDQNQSLEDELAESDGYLVVQPTEDFDEDEREAVEDFAENGGRVAVLAEPTQSQLSGGGILASVSTVSFGADELLATYGVKVGPEQLYNIEDEANDNNFKSIYATPDSDGSLAADAGTVTFDVAGHLTVQDGSDVEVVYTAAEGTRTLETRRVGTYPMVVRNDDVVVVADSDFIETNEVYDADNEEFVANLLEFLAGNDLDESGDDDTDQSGG